ncbi:pyridoxamine kinase [Tyzzerella sp. OttesenSCG-928-J15]|nr:pyridoxamine kinase [Tyzzerella sp. OttesenSCG-928-J15]
MQKRIMAINDISCYGRCAMTVALPILSAAGHECAIMPSAILSTHLAYPNPPSYSMTKQMGEITAHLSSINVEFDAISVGYLDNLEQIDKVIEFLNTFKSENTFVMADPTMADHGKMYGNPAYNGAFIEGMGKIVKRSAITVPNITEAAFLCNIAYEKPPYTKKYVETLLNGLINLGPEMAVVTGIIFDDEQIGSACILKDSGKISYSFAKQYKGRFIGTGDIFAAALMGALLNDIELCEAVEIATNFVSFAIEKTLKINTKDSMAINFEQSLPEYMRLLKIL